MLKRIHIDNYKCLNNFDLTFGDLTLLIGSNGCGKTAVFEVVGKLRDFIRGDGRVGELFSVGDLTKWTKNLEQSFELEFEFAGTSVLYRLVVGHHLEKRLSRVNREELTCDGKPLFEFANGNEVQLYRDDHSKGPKYTFDGTQSGIAPVAEGPDNKRLCAFRDRVRRFVTLFMDTRRIEPGTESDTDRLKRKR